MNGSHILAFPLLATALLVSACAGESETATREPEAPTMGPVEDDDEYWKLVWERNGPGDLIWFDFDSADLRPDAIDFADRMVRWLNEFHPDLVILVKGHTDDRGSSEYNLELGCRRAAAMRDALIERGIAAERLETISYGEERPAVLRGANKAGWENAWAQNRRAVLVAVEAPGRDMSERTCGE